MVLSHLRFAAGVCVLAAGLLMGGAGGAVAVADPGSSGSAAHGDDGTNASGQQSSTEKLKNEPGGTATTDGTLGGQSGQQPSAEKPKNEPGGTATQDETKDSGPIAADTNAVAPATNGVVAPATNGVVAPATDGVVVAPVTDEVVVAPATDEVVVAPATNGVVVAPATNGVVVAPATDGVAPATNGVVAATNGVVVAPATNGVVVAPATDGVVVAPATSGVVVAPATNGVVVAPATNGVAPVSDVIALIQDMLTSVAGTVVPLTQLQSDLYSSLLVIAGGAPVPNLVAAVSDVIALIQDMLTSVAGAVAPLLTQLQSALYSFLFGIAGVQPVVAGLGGDTGLSAAAGASVASQRRLVLSLAGILRGPLAGNAPAVPTLARLAASIFGATTQVAPNGAIPMGKQSVFRPAYSERLLPGSLSALPGAAGLMILNAAGVLPVSLAALAALALPGAGGLVILTGAGVRVGYRQAKAGFALRTAGIARFARPGAVPLGVVRSGSLVVVRPRALRVVRLGASSAGCLLDKVA